MITLCAPKIVIILFLTFFVYYIRMKNLSLNELKLIAKNRTINDYKNKSENDLISANQNQK